MPRPLLFGLPPSAIPGPIQVAPRPILKTLDIRRIIDLGPVSDSLDIRRGITGRSSISDTLDIRRVIQMTIKDTLDIRRQILQTLVASKALDIRRLILSPRTDTVQLVRGITASPPPPPPPSPPPPSGFFVDPNSGNDSNAGDATSRAWRTFAHGLATMTAGSTLWLRGGRYAQQDGLTATRDGTSGSPFTIKNYPGETPILDACFPEFQQAPNVQWELFDAATQTYRSIDTSYSTVWAPGGAMLWFASFISDDGEWYQLVPAHSLAELMSTQYSAGAAFRNLYYPGPSYFVNPSDNRIYIRMQNLQSPRNAGVPAATTDPRVTNTPPASPNNFNPNNYRIFISDCDHNFKVSGDFYLIDGLTFYGGHSNIQTLGRNCTLLSCTHRSYRTLFEWLTSTRNFLARYCDGDSGFPPYVAWREIKDSNGDPPQASDHQTLKCSIAVVDDPATGLVISDCLLRKHFDGVTIVALTTDGAGDVLITHNRIEFLADDGCQFNGKIRNLEMSWNIIGGCAFGYDGETSFVGGEEGKFCHHNLLIPKIGRLGTREGGFDGGQLHWRQSGKTNERHSLSSPYDVPVKFYNNTILADAPFESVHDLTERQISRNRGFHAVYNNIITMRGSVNTHIRQQGRAVQNSIEDYDNNLYFYYGTVGNPMFLDYNGVNYATLTALQTAGGEPHSTLADPLLPAALTSLLTTLRGVALDARPASGSPARTGARDLSATGWPGATSAVWRGAVDPASTDPLGGVGPRPRTS